GFSASLPSCWCSFIELGPLIARPLLATLAATACLLAVAASAGGAPPRAVSVTLDAPVRHLAADAGGVAVHTRSGAGCDAILLWMPPARPTKVTLRNCPQPSTGAGVTSLALDGRRPAWVGFAGGNYREFTVSTTLRTRPTYVSFHPVLVERSEERRVGKEGMSLWVRWSLEAEC